MIEIIVEKVQLKGRGRDELYLYSNRILRIVEVGQCF